MAERDSAISVQRDRHRDDGQRLLRLTVRDLDALARHLGIALLATRMADADAEARLDRWRACFQVISEALEAWAQGRGPGHGPETAADLADAARVVEARLANAGAERMLRRESIRLLGDSKRLEALTPWLALLVGGEVTGGARARACLVRTRPEARTPADLTIKHLASFHDAVACEEAADGLLVYTGGMPSAAWRRACARVLQALPDDAPVCHWGDIDEGGFRIAATLAATMKASGRVLQPWLMSPADLSSIDAEAARRPLATQHGAMLRWAQTAGWPDIADALTAHPLLLEQEALRARLPLRCHASSVTELRHPHNKGVDPV